MYPFKGANPDAGALDADSVRNVIVFRVAIAVSAVFEWWRCNLLAIRTNQWRYVHLFFLVQYFLVNEREPGFTLLSTGRVQRKHADYGQCGFYELIKRVHRSVQTQLKPRRKISLQRRTEKKIKIETTDEKAWRTPKFQIPGMWPNFHEDGVRYWMKK